MKQCKDYLEQISAFADGELLCSNEIRDVVDHLAQCDYCTAFLDFSREISGATLQSKVEPPSELRSLVMNKIMAEPITVQESENFTNEQGQPFYNNITPITNAQKNTSAPERARRAGGQKQKKPLSLRLVMTRLVPIAACLAIAVFAWQFFGGFGPGQYNALSPAAEMAAPAAADAMAPAPEAPLGEHQWDMDDEAAEAFAEQESDEFSQLRQAGVPAEDSADNIARAPFADDDANAEVVVEAEDDHADDADGGSYAGQDEVLHFALSDRALTAIYGLDYGELLFGHSDELTDEELYIMHSELAIEDTSFIIAIMGTLPEYLERFAPLPTEQFMHWDKVFVLTTDEAMVLLMELAYGAMEHERIERDMRNPHAVILFIEI